MSDEIKELQKKIKVLEQQLTERDDIINKYEENGTAKLYYALQRKAWEMADMLNSVNLKNLDLDDPKNKSFERVVKLLENSEKVANCTKALGVLAGVTGDEDKDVARKPFIETVATRRD
jgi:hypothetical protein